MWDLGPNFLRLLYSLKARYSNKLDQIRIIRVLHLTPAAYLLYLSGESTIQLHQGPFLI